MGDVDVMSVVVGPQHHGVVRHAATVAELTGTQVIRLAEPDDLRTTDLDGADVVHLHYADRLWGPDVERAAAGFERFVTALAVPVVVSLHDLPDGDGSAYDERRCVAYRTVADLVHARIVASEHERRRLRRLAHDGDFIPLPVLAPSTVAAAPTVLARTITVLGFIYPGKGHEDVIDAAAALERPVPVVCAGGTSPGHEDLVDVLTSRAGRVPVRISGALTDAEVDEVAVTTAVPVVPARNPSASASLATWIGAGRRPLAAANAYTVELASWDPTLVTLYDPTDPRALPAAIGHALAHPASTWRHGPLPAVLRPDCVAAAHHAVYRRVHRCTTS